MDLGLEYIPLNGRKMKQRLVNVVRDLEPDDLDKLEEERGVQKYIPKVRRLSERHRNLARVIAAGKTTAEASAITGYAAAYICILNGDPAFKELVNVFRQNRDIIYEQVHEKIAGISDLAADILRDKLEEDDTKVSYPVLLDIMKAAADRSGNGPSSTNVSVNVNLADRLEAARKRITNRVIDVTPEKE